MIEQNFDMFAILSVMENEPRISSEREMMGLLTYMRGRKIEPSELEDTLEACRDFIVRQYPFFEDPYQNYTLGEILMRFSDEDTPQDVPELLQDWKERRRKNILEIGGCDTYPISPLPAGYKEEHRQNVSNQVALLKEGSLKLG